MIGGLVTSTILTLTVIPAIYTLPLQFHFTHAKRQEPKGE